MKLCSCVKRHLLYNWFAYTVVASCVFSLLLARQPAQASDLKGPFVCQGITVGACLEKISQAFHVKINITPNISEATIHATINAKDPVGCIHAFFDDGLGLMTATEYNSEKKELNVTIFGNLGNMLPAGDKAVKPVKAPSDLPTREEFNKIVADTPSVIRGDDEVIQMPDNDPETAVTQRYLDSLQQQYSLSNVQGYRTPPDSDPDAPVTARALEFIQERIQAQQDDKSRQPEPDLPADKQTSLQEIHKIAQEIKTAQENSKEYTLPDGTTVTEEMLKNAAKGE